MAGTSPGVVWHGKAKQRLLELCSGRDSGLGALGHQQSCRVRPLRQVQRTKTARMRT